LHEDLWALARATGDGLGRAARMGTKNPRAIPGTARQGRPPGDADHGRGHAELADDRLPVPAVAVLPGDRWRRRADPGFGRAREGFPAKAGLPSRHRRECRDADGQPHRHSCESRNPGAPWVPVVALDPRFRGGDEIIITSSRAFRVAGPEAFAEAGITHKDVDHLMIYDAPVRCQGQALRICRSTA